MLDAANQIAFRLRNEHRIKQNTDYALIVKYQEAHLLCCEVYLPTIQEEAARVGITFKSIHTYPIT